MMSLGEAGEICNLPPRHGENAETFGTRSEPAAAAASWGLGTESIKEFSIVLATRFNPCNDPAAFVGMTRLPEATRSSHANRSLIFERSRESQTRLAYGRGAITLSPGDLGGEFGDI
jgi:hypothetical protein